MDTKNQQQVKELFLTCETSEDKYHKIMELGKKLPPYPEDLKTPDRVVKGCQSIVYLNATLKEGKVYFQVFSEALISAGLAELLLRVYSGQTPEYILNTPPTFLEELNIPAILSPGRANGLLSIHLRIKQEALKAAIK